MQCFGSPIIFGCGVNHTTNTGLGGLVRSLGGNMRRPRRRTDGLFFKDLHEQRGSACQHP